MCYSETASIVSFVTGVLSISVLYHYNPVIALFFGWVIAMQLFDYIFWRNQKRSCINYWTTKVATVFNALQPIVLAALIVYVGKRPLEVMSKWLLVVYIIVMGVYLLWHWTKIDYTLAGYKGYKSLYWKWNYMSGSAIVYGLFLLVFLALIYQHFDTPSNLIIGILVLGSFIFSYFYVKESAVGRIWCYFAGFVPLILVFIYWARGYWEKYRGNSQNLKGVN
jgi:hypothetical protein